MTWHNYQLERNILKTNEVLTLWKMEKGLIEISKNTLAIPIKLGDDQKGYVFQGQGKLVLDTIVETDDGAVGKPIEKEIAGPFLMLGETEDMKKGFVTAEEDDLKTMGYESKQQFVAKANDLLDQFLGRDMVHHHCCGHNNGVIFAFQNKSDKLDILVNKGSKLIYKATDTVYVSNKCRVVLKTPNEVVVSGNRKSFAFKC
jgi:hypothetical protein